MSTQAGFTLVETLVAIFILALTVGALLTLTASGYFSIRYAKNDITAANLLQESLEYIRNSRDSASQKGTPWTTWIQQYTAAKCDTTGCVINPYDATAANKIIQCPVTGCFNVRYFTNGFYGYNNFDDSLISNAFGNPSSVQTSFVRTITIQQLNPNGTDPQLVVTAKMDWLNGTHPKHAIQSIVLTNWNLP